MNAKTETALCVVSVAFALAGNAAAALDRWAICAVLWAICALLQAVRAEFK